MLFRSKYLYDLNKKKAKPSTEVFKEIRFSTNIADNDYKVKIRQARDFLSRAYRVKFTVESRERNSTNSASQFLLTVLEDLNAYGTVETSPRMENNKSFAIMRGKKNANSGSK